MIKYGVERSPIQSNCITFYLNPINGIQAHWILITNSNKAYGTTTRPERTVKSNDYFIRITLVSEFLTNLN